MRKKLWPRLLISCLALAVALAACELGFRLLAGRMGIDTAQLTRFQDHVARGGIAFEPRPHTVFARPRDARFANSQGFSDVEWKLEREPGTHRILCLGASTTEGGNPEGRRGSYPFLLQEELARRTGERFEVMNGGISGWTTAETLVAWFLLFQDYAPDVVIIHHAINDVHPRNRDGFRTDYVHWRHPFDPPRYAAPDRWLVAHSRLFAWLRMDASHQKNIGDLTTFPAPRLLPFGRDGAFPPGSELAFRRNVESIGLSAADLGATVVLMTMPLAPRFAAAEPARPMLVGMREHDRILRELAAEHGWLLVDAERLPTDDPEIAKEFLDIVHLTPAGNAKKAAMAAEVLLREWFPGVAGH